MDIPKLRKKAADFLLSEEGKITKQAIVAIGGTLGAIALGSIAAKDATAGAAQVCDPGEGTHDAAKHCYGHRNEVSGNYTAEQKVRAMHQHHYNHGSHASHGNHTSCCFPEGTKISMDGCNGDIEKVKIGASVLSYDLSTREKRFSTVKEIEAPIREGVYDINGGELLITNEHPIYAQKNNSECWAAIDPEATKNDTILKVSKLEVGDKIFHETRGWVKVISISYKKGTIQTFNLSHIDSYNNFFANGFLVHNKMSW